MTNDRGSRGYDDTRELMEMAVGIFDGRFKSVEHAARSVLDDPKQSNVDRLRRKFREQFWMDRGRDEFLRRSNTSTTDHLEDVSEVPLASYLRVIGTRLGRPVTTVRAVFTKDVFYDAPWIHLAFHAWWLGLLPVIVNLGRIALGLGLSEGFAHWHTPIFVLLSMFPLAFCLLALEEYDGFPNLGSRGDDMFEEALGCQA